MKNKFIYIILIIILILFFGLNNIYSDTLKDWFKEKEKAEKLYKERKYDEAIILFREIILSSDNDDLTAEMYFWLAKAYMDSNKLDQAEKNLEYYLTNYKKKGLNIAEAYYQKGRLLFLQEQYHSSIEQLDEFIKKYPFHNLVSNAYYWIGECLYALGQFDDSAYYFEMVIKKYPGSVKKEASTYKLRLIEHKKSELALQNILKWSQEQYISSLNQYRIREKTLREALEKYKKGGQVIEDDFLEKYKELTAENEILKQKVIELEEKNKQLRESFIDKDLSDRLKQIELKEQLLKEKEETLRVLEEELSRKESRLDKK